MSTLHRTSTPEQQPIEKHRQERGHDFYPSADQLAQIRRIYGTDPVPTRDKSLWLHYFTGPAPRPRHPCLTGRTAPPRPG